MNAITYDDAHAKLDQTMQRVCQDHAPLVMTRTRGGWVVMLSLDAYQALEETAHLLGNPRNAQRLLSAVTRLPAGKTQHVS